MEQGYNWTDIWSGRFRGDYNGDGCSDVIFKFRSREDSQNLNVYPHAQRYSIHYGSPEGISLEPDMVIPGNDSVAYMISHMNMRFNDDEYTDLVTVWQHKRENLTDPAYFDLRVYYGSPDGLSNEPGYNNTSQMGWYSRTYPMDINKDGLDDFVTVRSDNIYKPLPPYTEPRINLTVSVHFNKGSYFEMEPDVEHTVYNISGSYTFQVSPGDFDGDGIGDLAIGTGGFVIGSVSYYGHLMIFFGSGLSLLKDPVILEEGPRLYADYKAYEFLAWMGWSGQERPDDALFILDPTGANVVLRWQLDQNGSSWTVETGNDYVTLTSKEEDLLTDTMGRPIWLRFKVIFDWDWPHEDLCDVRIEFRNGTGPAKSFERKGMFSVENDLEFVGDLSVIGEYQGVLEQNQWVAGGEFLSGGGPKVVYEGTTDIYPPAGTCDVVFLDDDGDSSRDTLDTDGNYEISISADDVTDITETLTLTLDGLPGAAQLVRELNFRVRVDADASRLQGQIPDSDFWISTNKVVIAIVANDTGTSGVDMTTFEYSYYDGVGLKDWRQTNLQISRDADLIEGVSTLTLPEGPDHWVRWRVKDLVGNGYTYTDMIPIRVDTRNLTFSNPFPYEEVWHNVTPVSCGVTLMDLRGSGVDVSTIGYRVSPRNFTHYGIWVQWDPYGEDSQLIEALVDLQMEEGPFNYIQWRASDVAGNGLVVSPHYRVQVDTQPVTYTGFWPTEIQNKTELYVGVSVRKGPFSSDVDIDTCMYRYRSGTGPWSRWMAADVDAIFEGSIYNIEAQIDGLIDGNENYVQFQVYDIARNGPALSPEFQVVVDLSGPKFELIIPDENAIQASTLVEIHMRISDTLVGVDPDMVFIRYTLATEGSYGKWHQLTVEPSGNSFEGTFQISFEIGDNNMIQFKGVDLLGNVAVSDPHRIWVNRPPVAVILTPAAGANQSTDEPIILIAKGSEDPDGQQITYEWYLDGTLISNEEETSIPGPMEPGVHEIELVVIDTMDAEDSTTIRLLIFEEDLPETPDQLSSTYWILIIIVFVIVIISTVIYLWTRDIK